MKLEKFEILLNLAKIKIDIDYNRISISVLIFRHNFSKKLV